MDRAPADAPSCRAIRCRFEAIADAQETCASATSSCFRCVRGCVLLAVAFCLRYRAGMTAVGWPDHPLLDAADTETVRLALHDLAGGAVIAELHSSVDGALHGSDEATRRYVRDYRHLTRCLLMQAREVRPDLIVDLGDDGLFIADATGRPARALLWALLNGSAEAPFTPWTAQFELGDAVALDLTNRFRSLIGLQGLPMPAEPPRVPVDDVAAQRFLRYVRHLLNHPDDEPPLLRLMELFALSKTELGALFGVSRQAIDGWLRHGVPADRQEKLAALLALADVLERKLKRERVPGVARRPAEAYGGQTMLELIAADRHTELLELVRASFDWSQAA
jgi:hypothetical protein